MAKWKNEFEKDISRNPRRIKNTFVARKYLYEYLSTIGPNTNDPIKIPIGNMDARVPLFISDSAYSDDSCGNVAPRVIKDMPNIKITTHEAVKTRCLL